MVGRNKLRAVPARYQLSVPRLPELRFACSLPTWCDPAKTHSLSGRIGRCRRSAVVDSGRRGVLQVSSAPPRPFKRPTLPSEGKKNELHDLQAGG